VEIDPSAGSRRDFVPKRAASRREGGTGAATPYEQQVPRAARILPALAVALACAGHARAADAAPKPTCATKHAREHAELGVVRHRDPACLRGLWLGADLGGVVLPARLGLFDRTVWTLRTGPAWAIRLAPWLSAGGRHGLSVYDAGNVRLRVHDHQVEVAAHPLASARPGVHDRLSIGLETHAVLRSTVDGVQFKLGGVRDAVLYAGYGIDHRLTTRWSLGWHAHFRHAWVFRDTQRQIRAGARVAFFPTPAHRIAATAVGFFVDRSPTQAGGSVPRRGVYGQFGLEYSWMSRVGIGPALNVRYTTGFLTGEAPIYEARSESMSTSYADATLGLRFVWK